jgi:hypothetical protein
VQSWPLIELSDAGDRPADELRAAAAAVRAAMEAGR